MPNARLTPIRWLSVFLVTAALGFAQPKSGFAGDYAGTLGAIPVILHLVAGGNGTLTGTVDFPGQDLFKLPCTEVNVRAQSLSFTVPRFQGTWVGFISANGTSLTGTWNSDSPVPLNFVRSGAAANTTTTATSSNLAQAIAGTTSPSVPVNGIGATPSAIRFDETTHTITVPRPDGVTVTFVGEDVKIVGFQGVNYIVRHKKGSASRLLESGILHPTRAAGGVAGGGEEFLLEGGGIIFDSGMGIVVGREDSRQVLMAKQLSQIAVDAVADVHAIAGHENFAPPGYNNLKEISGYRLRSDGSR